MRGEIAVMARATGGPPPPPESPWAALRRVMGVVLQRLSALEARPLPRDGRDGKDGMDGRAGDAGIAGEQGAAGRGIVSVRLDGQMIALRYTDGTEERLGPVIVAAPAARSIVRTIVHERDPETRMLMRSVVTDAPEGE